MAYTTRSLSQQIYNFSVPREPFLRNVVDNDDFSKKQLRVLLLLLAHLDGYQPAQTKLRGDKDDPLNFKEVNKKEIAKSLGLSKSDVDDAFEILLSYKIIEKGRNRSNRKGYRFMF